jgi:uncharacterized protein (TIGR02611 family)
MIDRTKQNWQEFKQSKPGHRFRDRYERRQQAEHGRWSAGKILNIVGGLALVAAGIFLVAAPGPGWITVFIGLGLIGSEFLPIARVLDLGEVKGRVITEGAKALWDRSSMGVKILIGLLATICVAALGYGAYYLVVGGSN